MECHNGMLSTVSTWVVCATSLQWTEVLSSHQLVLLAGTEIVAVHVQGLTIGNDPVLPS